METERTLFSEVTQDDYAEVLKLYSNEEVRKYLGGSIEQESFGTKFQEMLRAVEPEKYWIVRQKSTLSLIGLVSISEHHDKDKYEVSYELHPDMWNQGYGTEIVRQAIQLAFTDLGLTKLCAETQKKNTASIKLLEKVGMQFESEVTRFGEQQVIYIISK